MGELCSCAEQEFVDGQCVNCQGFDCWDSLEDYFESQITFRDMSYDVDYL